MSENQAVVADQAAAAAPVDRIGSKRLVGVVMRRVAHDTGMSATLRRLDPQDRVGAPALHAVLAEAEIELDPRFDDDWERHACCARIIALLQRVAGEPEPVGRGWARIGVSESRLARLGKAGGRPLRDIVTGLVRRAASQGARIDARELCDLIICEGRSGWRSDVAVRALRRIMSDYYRHVDSEAAKAAKAGAA